MYLKVILFGEGVKTLNPYNGIFVISLYNYCRFAGGQLPKREGEKEELEAMNGWSGRGSMGIALIAILTGCTSGVVRTDATWETYRNDRFGFVFLYPSDWISAPPPSNFDGQVFIHPHQPQVLIRGWAGYRLAEGEMPDTNFTTQQGREGHLRVEIGDRVSIMTLQVVRDDIAYAWYAQAPTDEFSRYYRLFDYMARHYRIEN